MLAPIYIVDDFYTDPDRVRALALSLEYAQTPGSHDGFPGLRSTTRYFTASHLRSFRRLIPAMGFRDRPENGAFQFLPKSAAPFSRIHADGRLGWAGVLYLNPDRDGTPGTSFHHHIKLGCSALPTTRTRIDFAKRIWNDGAHIARWTEVACVSIRYNRLVLFKRNRFHRNASAFGSTYGDARLAQVFFF